LETLKHLNLIKNIFFFISISFFQDIKAWSDYFWVYDLKLSGPRDNLWKLRGEELYPILVCFLNINLFMLYKSPLYVRPSKNMIKYQCTCLIFFYFHSLHYKFWGLRKKCKYVVEAHKRLQGFEQVGNFNKPR